MESKKCSTPFFLIGKKEIKTINSYNPLSYKQFFEIIHFGFDRSIACNLRTARFHDPTTRCSFSKGYLFMTSYHSNGEKVENCSVTLKSRQTFLWDFIDQATN